MRSAAKQRGARDVTGRRLSKPLSTGSTQTLDVERSERTSATAQRDFGHGDAGSAGQQGLGHTTVGGAKNLRRGRRLTIPKPSTRLGRTGTRSARKRTWAGRPRTGSSKRKLGRCSGASLNPRRRKPRRSRQSGAKDHERLAERGVNLSLRRYEAENLKGQDVASEGRRGRGNP